MIPAAHDAENDPAIKGLPLTAYNNLRDELDLDRFREVKSLWLESVLKCTDRTVRRVMGRLVLHGYIVRGAWRPGEVCQYKLVYRRGEKERALPTARGTS